MNMLAIKNNKFEVHVFIGENERVLSQSFFWTNLPKYDGEPCVKCGKPNLGRLERVDCEFWPGDTETWCLDCWVNI